MMTEPAGRREAAFAGSLALPGDYWELLKPRVMSLVIFTGRRPSLWRGSRQHRGGARFVARHGGRGGRVGRAQHGLRGRHRRRDEAHQRPADPDGPGHIGRSLCVRHRPVGLLRHADRHRRERAFGGAAGFHDRVLFARLHRVAEARDAAEHRDRRGRRRPAPDDRLFHRDQLGDGRQRHPVPHHLRVDAATFLGAGAAEIRRLRQGRHPDDAQRQGHGADAGRDLLTPIVLAPLGVAPWATGLAGPVYGVVAAVTGAAMLLLAWRCYSVRVGPEADRAAKTSSPSRSCTCSCSSPCCWPSGACPSRRISASRCRWRLPRDDGGIVLSPAQQRSRRARNVAIGIAVGCWSCSSTR